MFYENKIIFLILFISILTTRVAGAVTEGLSLSSYKLSTGDIISINVYGEEDLSLKSIRLTDAGTFSYPFLGEIKAKGKTVGELRRLIASGLRGDYLIAPDVTVSISEYRKFFVHGQVRSPGGFSFEPGLNLQKAIALAGGFTERASRKEIEVIRDAGGKQEQRLLTLGEKVFPGDIINVKESFF